MIKQGKQKWWYVNERGQNTHSKGEQVKYPFYEQSKLKGAGQ